MSTHQLDLGKARFVCDRTHLSVEIRAAAALYAEASDSVDLDPDRLTVGGDVWVCKSHDFCISFVVSTDRDTHSAAKVEPSHLEEIETALEAAQLWQQLGLQPNPLPKPPTNHGLPEPSKQSFVLEIHDDLTDQSQIRGASREPQQTPSDVATLRAPTSVQTVQLVSILISLHFHAVYTDGTDDLNGCGVEEHSSFGNKDQVTAYLDQLDKSATEFASLLENDDLGPWKTTDRMTQIEHQEPAERMACAGHRQGVVSPILSLTDIALRSLICPKPTRQPAWIKSVEENLSYLADLAPTVFVPSYRGAVQGRTRLIWPIAKFLSRFLQQSGREWKFVNSINHFDAGLGRPASNEDRITEQKDALQGHLWMTLANGVKSLESARKLKPLHVAPTDQAQYSLCRTFEDLLGPGLTLEEEETTPPFENGFEDLHLDGEECFSGSDDEEFSDLYDEIVSQSVAIVDVALGRHSKHSSDKFPDPLSSSPLDDRLLNTMSTLAPSSADSKHSSLDERHPTDALSKNNLHYRARKDLHMELDSSHSQPIEAVQMHDSAHAPLDLIGGDDYSNAYVSRTHPSYTSIDKGSYRSELPVFEVFDCHDFDHVRSISPLYVPSLASEMQSIIDLDTDRESTTLGRIDPDIGMPSYEKSNRSSLNDMIGGDHLLWQMWTKRRPSMIQNDEDILEMHTMYAQDPDMRLLDMQKAASDENRDEYILDWEAFHSFSTTSSSSMNGERAITFPCGPRALQERKQYHHHHFHLHNDTPPTAPHSQVSGSPTRRKLNRGQSFLKRLSGSGTSTEDRSNFSRRKSLEERDTVIKRRKTLEDYEVEGEEMLLN